MKKSDDEILDLDKIEEESVAESSGSTEDKAEAPSSGTDPLMGDSAEEVSVENEESEEKPVTDAAATQMGKHEEAVSLVEKARVIVTEAENQLDECKLLLSSDLEEYEAAKASLEDNGLKASENVLNRLGHKVEEHSDVDEDMVVFEPKEELAPIRIQNVSSGAFSGFIMALIAGFATLAGMVYIVTEKIGMTLDVSKVPGSETINSIMQWYAALVGMGDNPPVGGSMIVLAVLIVMWIVYKIRVSLKASSNLHMAKAQLAAAEEYSAQKGTCKEEMDRVDAYIKESIKTLKLYQVVLSEQKSKLDRILHIEEEHIETAAFHNKSKVEIADTMELIAKIKNFMSVPMSEEGKLSEKSTQLLESAKKSIDKVLARFY